MKTRVRGYGKRQVRLYEILENRGRVSTKEIQELLGISLYSASQLLSEESGAGRIVRVSRGLYECPEGISQSEVVSPHHEPFGSQVERAMAERGLGYRRLAEEAGIANYGNLHKFIHGARRLPDSETMERIAAVLGLDVETFTEYRARMIADYLARHPEDEHEAFQRARIERA